MKLLNVQQVSEILGVTRDRVYELIRKDIIPAVHLGRQIRVSEEQLIEWIKKGGEHKLLTK